MVLWYYVKIKKNGIANHDSVLYQNLLNKSELCIKICIRQDVRREFSICNMLQCNNF